MGQSAVNSLGNLSGTILLAGAGKMGSAMLEGWLALGLPPEKIAALEPQPTGEITAWARHGLRLNPSPGAVGEVAAVARARGVALPADTEARIVAIIHALPGPMKPSFLLDLEAGGATELDDLSGTVSRLGRLAGVETPVHDVATAALARPPLR